ncbi:MAG: UvrD-helicase domain-containing protein, partial [Terriglobales bacterium]
MSSEAAAARGADDTAARLTALEVARSFLVRAPAGSGKTELLIQRTLALLAIVERPEAVVAVTFTRKAAGEMRNRILAALDAAAAPAPAEPHQRLTWELARRARERDTQLGWGLLAAPARLRVSTLDALALELVRRMPWLSRFGGVPQPEEDPAAMYAEAARATLADLETQGGNAAHYLVAQLDGDLDAAIALLARLLAVREQWPPLLAGGLREAVEAELAAQIVATLADVRRRLEACGAVAAAALPEA